MKLTKEQLVNACATVSNNVKADSDLTEQINLIIEFYDYDKDWWNNEVESVDFEAEYDEDCLVWNLSSRDKEDDFAGGEVGSDHFNASKVIPLLAKELGYTI